ncbi:MAG: heme exporter protein CcmB [Gammaproteobacteria bacterium]|jgi:heme exporter protein B|nr:heme exporter protein CcmB [Gammaproteobacteria bacterium]
MFSAFFTLMQYEIKITLRLAYSWLTPLLFFVIVVSLFPFAVGPDPILLLKIAPGILWVSALLAILISIDHLFRDDAQTGYLDLLLLSPHPLSLLMLSKIFAHWLTHCLPLIIISPLLGFLLHLPANEEYALVMSLLLGTPVLILLGAIGAALVVGIRSHGLLLPILIMPLYVPVLIFGTGALMAASLNQPINGYLAIMAVLLLLSLAFAPFLTGMALRIGVNQ